MEPVSFVLSERAYWLLRDSVQSSGEPSGGPAALEGARQLRSVEGVTWQLECDVDDARAIALWFGQRAEDLLVSPEPRDQRDARECRRTAREIKVRLPRGE